MEKYTAKIIAVIAENKSFVSAKIFRGVKRPSIIPAIISIKITPIIKDTAFLAPAINEDLRVYSPGKRKYLAIIKPEAPEIKIAVSSIMP